MVAAGPGSDLTIRAKPGTIATLMTEFVPPPTFDAPPKRDAIPRWIIPIVLAVLLVAAAIGIVIVAGQQGGEDAPPAPAPFEPEVHLGVSYRQFDVRQVDGSVFTVSSLTASEEELLSFELSETARLELLDHATVEDIELGQWITVIGIPNAVFNFSITTIVIIPDFIAGANNLATTPGGFYGHEAGRPLVKGDVLRPTVGGEVIAIAVPESDDNEFTTEPLLVVTLAGPDGEIELELFASAPLMLQRQASPSDIQSGDRIAVHAISADDPSRAGSVLISRPPLEPALLGAESLGVGAPAEDAGGED